METNDGIFNIHNETFLLILNIVEFHSKATGAFNLEFRCVHKAKTLKVDKLNGKLLQIVPLFNFKTEINIEQSKIYPEQE